MTCPAGRQPVLGLGCKFLRQVSAVSAGRHTRDKILDELEMVRILVVDDNATSRELLRHVFKPAFGDVLEASRGEEALEKIARERPDLVLLDLEMPGLDGYAVLRRVRQDTRLAALRVVAVTARAMQGDREKALAAGFDGYITKPIDAVGLREYVAQLLGGESAGRGGRQE